MRLKYRGIPDPQSSDDPLAVQDRYRGCSKQFGELRPKLGVYKSHRPVTLGVDYATQ